jgi:YD repeat-containing protein
MYDAQGNQTSQIDPAGNTSTFTYDSVGLVAEGTSCGGDNRHEYDAAGEFDHRRPVGRGRDGASRHPL